MNARAKELLDAANLARIRGDHEFANAFIWLMTSTAGNTEGDAARADLQQVQQRRQAVKETFSAHPFPT